MTRLGLDVDVVDAGARARAVRHFRERGIRLPTFGELADPETIPVDVAGALEAVDPDAADPLNLFRVHWHCGPDRRRTAVVPEHVVLTEELTGVPSPIVVAYGDRFPMIRAHKVLAAYGCLAPRLVTGAFDPGAHRAIWPSTGNYCRGGVAISRILGCRGVAVLPEGMSEERFAWLESWIDDPADVVRTPGSESNVKEIYDACAELEADERNVVFNQFCELGNHLVHYACTGASMERLFDAVAAERPGLRLAAFVSATGSAGTLGAGDRLKDRYGSRNVAVEALECPTLLYNGFGEHNIQGIGDKHVPLIHNVTNTDAVVGVSDRTTDTLHLYLRSDAGRAHFAEGLGLPGILLRSFDGFGLSSLCNLAASIKLSKALDLGPEDAVLTVATDGAEMYGSEIQKILAKRFPGGFGADEAAAAWQEHLAGLDTAHVLELDDVARDRIFNLGYFTWVEQRGITLEEFEARRDQAFWRGLRSRVGAWDALIEEFNAETGTGATAE